MGSIQEKMLTAQTSVSIWDQYKMMLKDASAYLTTTCDHLHVCMQTSAYIIPTHIVRRIVRDARALDNLQICNEIRLYSHVATTIQTQYESYHFSDFYELQFLAFVASIGTLFDSLPSNKTEDQHLDLLQLFTPFRNIFHPIRSTVNTHSASRSGHSQPL